MSKEEKLKNLYNGVLENKELTTGELKSYGFSSKDLTKLVRDGVLVRQARGLYEFKDAEAIYQYRLEVIPVKMGQCIDKCYEIDAKHVGANLKLFMRNLRKGKFAQAVPFLENLYFNQDDTYRSDYNLYWFLLDKIVELPENVKGIINNLNLDDCLVKEADKEVLVDNEIRTKIFRGELNAAITELMGKQPSYIKEVLIFLLKAAKNMAKTEITYYSIVQINQMIKSNKFEELQQYLSLKQAKSFLEEKLLVLLNKIIEMLRTLKIPERRVNTTEAVNIYKLIEYGLFDEALEKSAGYCKMNGKDKENNSLYLLLAKIDDLIGVISIMNIGNYARLLSFLKYNVNNILFKEYLMIVSQAIVDVSQGKPVLVSSHDNTIDGAIKVNDFASALVLLDNSEDFLGKRLLIKAIEDYLGLLNKEETKPNLTGIDLIFYHLTEGNKEEAIRVVHEYLLTLNLGKYEFLIVGLINLSLAMESLGFMDAISTLIAMSRGEFVPQYGSYVDWFYEAIYEGNVEEAKIYFDIISGFKNLGEMQVNMDNMRKALANLMQENVIRGRLIRF